MVYLKKRAENDLLRLLVRLAKWEKHPHTFAEAKAYVLDIADKCYELENLLYHRKTTFLTHIKFGKYVYRYDKHTNIQWYLIYNIDKQDNIIVQKIMSNNSTKN
jgi:mRNA-degrading endonuclease YafQ of YafQ-DinJ toxin-antitoxin module